MKRVVLLGLVAVLAGCHKSDKRDLDLTLNSNFANGVAVLTCKASSTGSCEALFVTGPTTARLSAAVGKSATQSGISGATAFCLDVAAPDPAKCHPQPLPQGEQIISSHSVTRH